MEDEMLFVHQANGNYWGWVDSGKLYTKDGRHIGYRQGSELFGLNGDYLGEIRSGRLVTNLAKKDSGKKRLGMVADRLRMLPPHVSPGDELEKPTPEGYEDFPDAENI